MAEKLQRRNAVRSRRMICEALMALLCEKEIDNITVTELVERADLNRSTFYSHYNNMMDVLGEVEENALSLLSGYLAERRMQAITPELVARHLCRLLLSPVFVVRGCLTTPVMVEVLHRTAERYLELCLQQASEVQLKQPGFELALRLTVSGTLDVMLARLEERAFSHMTPEQLADELVRLYSRI